MLMFGRCEGVSNNSSSSSSISGRDLTRAVSYAVPALAAGHAVDTFLHMPAMFPPASRQV